jgi:ubiquinone biosynthesis protein
MELVEGVKIDDLDSLQKMKIDRNTLVTTYFTSVLEQALLHGFFHADPHPANIFVQKNGTLVFLDFGIVGELSLSDRRKVLKFIDSIPVGDAQKSFDIALSLARWHEGADVQEFKREVLPLLLQVYNHDLSKGSLGHVLYKIMSLGSEYGVMFDPNHLLMAKAVYQAEGLAMKLDPHFKVNEALKVFMKDYFIQEYSPKQLVKRVKKSLWETKSLLMDLPDHIVKIIDRLEKQPKNTSAISQKQLTELESKLDRFSRRSTIEIIITLLLILGFVLLYLEGETHPFGIPLSVFVFVVIVGIIVYVYLKQKRK